MYQYEKELMTFERKGKKDRNVGNKHFLYSSCVILGRDTQES